MLVSQIGREGQEKLAAARIGLVGCGALGCMIATHLVRAGVGLVRIVDNDYPEVDNLHRQILFTEDDVARRVPKSEAAAAFLARANSRVMVEPVVATIDELTLPDFAADLDLLVDGTDNFPTRFVMNDYAVERGVPWVYGGDKDQRHVDDHCARRRSLSALPCARPAVSRARSHCRYCWGAEHRGCRHCQHRSQRGHQAGSGPWGEKPGSAGP